MSTNSSPIYIFLFSFCPLFFTCVSCHFCFSCLFLCLCFLSFSFFFLSSLRLRSSDRVQIEPRTRPSSGSSESFDPVPSNSMYDSCWLNTTLPPPSTTAPSAGHQSFNVRVQQPHGLLPFSNELQLRVAFRPSGTSASGRQFQFFLRFRSHDALLLDRPHTLGRTRIDLDFQDLLHLLNRIHLGLPQSFLDRRQQVELVSFTVCRCHARSPPGLACRFCLL